MTWTVDPASDIPPSRQLVEAILDSIASGRLEEGDRLPSVRKMAVSALLNHNTVARAYRNLEHLGVTQGRNGRGVYVTREGPRVARKARIEATRSAFEVAVEEALRAGHMLETLQQILSEYQQRVWQ